MSDELKLKMSLAKKGKVFTDEHKANLSKSHKGKIPSNIEILITYRKGRPLTDEHKKRIGEGQRGKVMSPEARIKIGLAGKGRIPWNKGNGDYMKGCNNHNWLEDRGKLKKHNRQIGTRHSEWVQACKARDGKKCRLRNKECSGQLEVHHIFRFSEYPDLRYELSNGITLCHFHHPRKKALEEEMRELFIKLIS